MEKKYFSVDEISRYAGLSKWFIYKCTAKKSFPIVKVGSRCLINIDKFDKWLEKHSIDSEEGK